MGPLNNEPTAAKMDEHVADALERGADVVTGGARAAGFPTQLYWEATVLDGVTDEMAVAREETFGPVVPITTIGGDEEALRIANESPYGLLCAVWTRDLARGLRFAEARRRGLGERQRVDELLGEPPAVRRPRRARAPGVGRVGGRHAIETFTEPKTVVITL